MKKIKYLLLGIVSLLGIGCSFGAVPFYFDYFTNNGGLTSYNLSNDSRFNPCIYKYDSVQYVTDLKWYQQSCNSSFNSSFNGFSVYYNSNGNKLTYRLNASSNSRPGYLFVLSSYLATENISDVGNGAYSRILAGSDCLGSDIFQSGSFCAPNFVQLFTNKYYTISSLGNIYDSDYNGVHYYKGPVSPSVGLGYSFGFVDGSGWQNSGTHYYLNDSDIFHFRTITFSGSTIFPIDGPLVFRLNNTTNFSDGESYKIIALGPTGDYQNFSFIYSIYNCPSSAIDIFDCVFSEGGNISENFSYDFESSNPYSNLIYLLTNPGAVKLNNSYSSSNNTLSLTSQLNSNIYLISNTTYTITLNLIPAVNGFDIIGNIEDNSGGGGNDLNQYTGVGSIPFSSLYYQCLGPSYNTPDGNPPAWCLNPDGSLINVNDYKDCYFTINSDGSISESFYCSVGNIIQEMTWTESGSGGYFSVCTGLSCSVDFFIGPSNFNFDPSFNLSTGLIEDMFTNITGWVGRCPFPYKDFQLGQNFGLVKYFKSLGYNFDPFILINCVIAGFSQGRNTITDMAGLSFFETPLLNGDTDQHRILFTFLDFILILGIFGLVAFFKKIF